MSGQRDPAPTPSSHLETAAFPSGSGRPAPRQLTPGAVLTGRYRIVAPLGKGGMGEVYRADDLRLGQPVALKFLPAALASDKDRLDRLVGEVRIGRQVSHPNVCRLYDIVEAEGHHFLVMEYVDGEDLASLLRRIGRLPADKALELARDLCAGLAAAHDQGVIHRDLKPANVMIDGHGHARIADFGLAAVAEGGAAEVMAGTPAYMAPEQLRGEPATFRSDVFALGLVLYEMFTGKRAFEAKSLGELEALHRDSRPPSVSSAARDVDPAVEQVVQRCLAFGPAERPASARLVLAALPGGDPLQAALLAGETPSPEMVAAAATVGDLRPALAWGALVAGLATLVLITVLSGRVMLFRRVPTPKPPEVLVEQARALLARLGYRDQPADTAFGFSVDQDFLEDLRAEPERSGGLGTTLGGPLLFYYRRSPVELTAPGWIPTMPWAGPPQLGRVMLDDPPLRASGMANVVLDTRGRLVSLAAVPPRHVPDAGPWPEVDWSIALTEAGLDPARLVPSRPRWTAPVDTDRKSAWDGFDPERPQVAAHVEAASYRGRPVYFEVQGPWTRPPRRPFGASTRAALATLLTVALTIAVTSAVVVLFRRNLRLGRGDRKGAVRVAALVLVTLVLAQSLRADHAADPVVEYSLLIHILSQGFYGALVTWFIYLALEPAVRRRWPHMLISWTRLLAGGVRDPLVGRDVLVGTLAGLCWTLAVVAPRAAGVGVAHSAPLITVLSTLSAPRHVAYYFLVGPCMAIIYSVSALFQLYLFHSLVRRVWLARLLVFLEFLLISLGSETDLVLGLVTGAIVAAVFVTVLSRVGLLSAVVLMFTHQAVLHAPLTLDWSAWYAGRSLATLLFFAALLSAAAYTSLGGRPLFGRALLED